MSDQVKTVVEILARRKWEGQRATDWDTIPRLSPWDEISDDLKEYFSAHLIPLAEEIVDALEP